MLHHHLNHQEFTLAAIDDIIDRGKPEDWAELREAALRSDLIMEKILRVASARVDDPYSDDLYTLWREFAQRHIRSAQGEK